MNLTAIKTAKSEAFAEGKQVYPFVRVDVAIGAYDYNGVKLNDGLDYFSGKLTKSNIELDVELLKQQYPSKIRKIIIEFTARGAETMDEFTNGYDEIVDGDAHEAVLWSL